MRGIEAAFWGTLGKDPELKTSKTGKPFATMSIVVTIGQADDGRDVSQWVRVVAFGQVAENIVARAKKEDGVYCEGSLTLNTWQSAEGGTKTGLNLAAWKVEKVAATAKPPVPREATIWRIVRSSVLKPEARRYCRHRHALSAIVCHHFRPANYWR